MGICVNTGRNGLVNERDVVLKSLTFGSWPKNLNDSQRFLRDRQTRTMSEPNMIPSGRRIRGSGTDTSEKSRSGPGPPKPVPLTFARKIVPIDVRNIPDIPLVFILGGPGSGKITHCERMTRDVEGLVHLNMLKVFLAVASEMGSRDPNIVPAYKALEVVSGELSNIKDVIALLVTGYPRNMRDVVEYIARVQRVDGVILLDWSDRSLERQVQLGAKMGEIDADLARFEMDNYRSNIISVAQFFDQQGLLHIVAGQRVPGEIYEDLREEVSGILSLTGPVESDETAKPVDGMAARTDSSKSHPKTEAVIHIPSENINSGRKKSVDSVDLMIAEEINHIINDSTLKEPLPIVNEIDGENTGAL